MLKLSSHNCSSTSQFKFILAFSDAFNECLAGLFLLFVSMLAHYFSKICQSQVKVMVSTNNLRFPIFFISFSLSTFQINLFVAACLRKSFPQHHVVMLQIHFSHRKKLCRIITFWRTSFNKQPIFVRMPISSKSLEMLNRITEASINFNTYYNRKYEIHLWRSRQYQSFPYGFTIWSTFFIYL